MTRDRGGREIALDALDWASLLRPGDLLVWGQASAEPVALVSGFLAARERTNAIRAFIGIGCSDSVTAEHVDRIAFQSYCGTGSNRRLGEALDILPLPYAELSRALGDQEPVLLLSLAPGKDEQHFSFGAAGDYTADLIDRARLVIAEVNFAAPRTGDGTDVQRSQIDFVVRTDRALPSPSTPKAGPIEERIARHIAALVEDGSTIQIGLGAIPAAVLPALAHHRDLGIHSGLITDAVADLAERGVVTNARKSIDRGLAVTGLLAGSARLMGWADQNGALAIRPTRYTHDSLVLGAIDRLVAINSAIEIDLGGQVNAEVAGGRYVGAVGGASAFLRGAQASHGGLPIIALPSMAGERSRIVSRLSGPVSTQRSDVGLVVTEHGVADLRGLGLSARRDALLSIAAPSQRGILEHGPTAA